MILRLLTNPWVLVAIIALAFTATYRIQSNLIKDRDAEIALLANNSKAYERNVQIWRDRYGQEHAKSIMFNQTLNEFKRSTDSINRRMYSLLNAQDKKLKNVETLIYSRTGIDTTLTIPINIPTMPDTTLDLSNEWITNIVSLSPTRVSSQVELDNELLASLSYKKETVKPPKKFFLFRWFQKRHVIIEAEVTNTNQLIETRTQRFIKVQE